MSVEGSKQNALAGIPAQRKKQIINKLFRCILNLYSSEISSSVKAFGVSGSADFSGSCPGSWPSGDPKIN